ncbi:uncharacterized protein EAE97_006902 [Botrytis byssoidea]|uniref:Transcription factor domain-containing protein n=1 Tax=Botrytis byssoidea TaxID=139641 RepID=A0A9P5IJD4_9HELO|nr:uncharacterized protein EAE97_006902 [Botrytis byssoidea]KAF7940716.1 hypothetical protein EAE97_006902 [Botrytis byssoidea]
MDRDILMLYGRPSMIDPQAAAAIPVPLIVEEDDYQPRHNEEDTIGRPQASIADFYKSYIELYNILNGITLPRMSRLLERTFPFLNLQEKLSTWEQNIPDHLRIEQHLTYNDLNAVSTRRAVVLHQRYLHVQSLLLTPILQQLIGAEFQKKAERIRLGSLLSRRITLQCAIVCVKIAQEAIDTVHIRENSDLNEISPWWCNVIFLYKSATALIAGSLCPSIVAEISETAIHESFHKATLILRQYTTFNPSILRLVTILDILFQIVPQKFSRLKNASERIEAEAGPPTSDENSSAATFQYWCPIKPIRHAASAHQDAVHPSPENSGSSQILTDLDRLFDTDDFKWLTKMPFDT